MSRIVRMINSLFVHMGQAAEYYAVGQAPLPALVLLKPLDPYIEINDRPISREAYQLDVRVTEVAEPRLGHLWQVGHQRYRIETDPQRDAGASVWTMQVAPIASHDHNDSQLLELDRYAAMAVSGR